MKKIVLFFIIIHLFYSCKRDKPCQDSNDIVVFGSLPLSWDKAVPLGNGMTGVLVWKKDGKLRLSLDRADLWDLRPMGNIGCEEWSFNWVYKQWESNNYSVVQERFDAPYEALPAPSKIPAAAVEFDISALGDGENVILDIDNGICLIKWPGGATMQVFVDASGEAGWYRFGNAGSMIPVIIPPAYSGEEIKVKADMAFNSLTRLGYKTGTIERNSHHITYTQEGWGGLKYSVRIAWCGSGRECTGNWIIDKRVTGENNANNTDIKAIKPNKYQYNKALKNHVKWWSNFWAASSVSVPDTVLMRQWQLDMYKFGCVAREDTPPVSLQAVWTADNGMLPPWKGDFHHDLNTELSYWSSYSSNHIDLASGYTNWLWKNRDTFKRYTNDYFGCSGINVPGVTTLTGEPMGGWIQYSFGPTVSSWLAHHFYLQWKYSLDTVFLREKAYPWICETAQYIEEFSVKDNSGMRRLPLSSSPEFNDNRREAWFASTTNFDLALIRWTYMAAIELAGVLQKDSDMLRWKRDLDEWPDLAVDDNYGLLIAPGLPYSESHRHFSHLMALFPLELISADGTAREKEIFSTSVRNLEKAGCDYWTGYSYAWLANIYARAGNGEEAAKALRIFSRCFCLSNSFHVNGDQCDGGFSRFTYKPFTLEGNFAAAAALQAMLLQGDNGVVKVFPAVPHDWKEVSFESLRAEGALLVSAVMKDGSVIKVILTAEKGGIVRMINPFSKDVTLNDGTVVPVCDTIVLKTKPGESYVFD